MKHNARLNEVHFYKVKLHILKAGVRQTRSALCKLKAPKNISLMGTLDRTEVSCPKCLKALDADARHPLMESVVCLGCGQKSKILLGDIEHRCQRRKANQRVKLGEPETYCVGTMETPTMVEAVPR